MMAHNGEDDQEKVQGDGEDEQEEILEDGQREEEASSVRTGKSRVLDRTGPGPKFCILVDRGPDQHQSGPDRNPKDRKSTRLNSSHRSLSRMPSSA